MPRLVAHIWLWHSAGSIPTMHGRTRQRSCSLCALFTGVLSHTSRLLLGALSVQRYFRFVCFLGQQHFVSFRKWRLARAFRHSLDLHTARGTCGGGAIFRHDTPQEFHYHVFRSLEREGASPPPFHVLCHFLWSNNDNIKDMASVLFCTTELCAKLCASYVYMYQQIPKIPLLSCPLLGERVRNVVITSPRK